MWLWELGVGDTYTSVMIVGRRGGWTVGTGGCWWWWVCGGFGGEESPRLEV